MDMQNYREGKGCARAACRSVLRHRQAPSPKPANLRLRSTQKGNPEGKNARFFLDRKEMADFQK